MKQNIEQLAKKYPKNDFDRELMSLADKQNLFRELLELDSNHRLDQVEIVIELALEYVLNLDQFLNQYYEDMKEELIKNSLTAHAETIEQLKKSGEIKPIPKK